MSVEALVESGWSDWLAEAGTDNGASLTALSTFFNLLGNAAIAIFMIWGATHLYNAWSSGSLPFHDFLYSLVRLCGICTASWWVIVQ